MTTLMIYYATGSLFVAASSAAVYYVLRRHDLKPSSWLLCLMAALSSYMLPAQYLKYRSLHFYADFSHWAQILFNIAKTAKPLCPSQEMIVAGAQNYFSVHFVPLIYFIASPFAIWPYSETIILLNFLLMISAVIPLYKLALQYNGDKQFGLFMIVMLLWYPTFQYTVMYEFEMLRFSIPIIFWMLYFWERKKTVLYFIFVLLAVLVREEVGLTIMMFGAYLWLVERRKKIGLATSLIGLGAFIIITQLIMPALREGATYSHIAGYWFAHPLTGFSVIFEIEKTANIYMLFLPLSFIPFLAPSALFPILANLGVGMLSGSITHISYMMFYLSPSVPFIFYAFIKGWGKTKNATHTTMWMALAGILASNVFFGPSPISLQFWFKNLRPAPFRTQDFHYSVYRVSPHHLKVEDFCKLKPDDSVI